MIGRYNNKMAYKVVDSVDCCTNLSLKLNITLNTMRIRAMLGDVLGRNSIKAATISDLLPVVTRGFGPFQVAIA